MVLKKIIGFAKRLRGKKVPRESVVKTLTRSQRAKTRVRQRWQNLSPHMGKAYASSEGIKQVIKSVEDRLERSGTNYFFNEKTTPETLQVVEEACWDFLGKYEQVKIFHKKYVTAAEIAGENIKWLAPDLPATEARARNILEAAHQKRIKNMEQKVNQ